MKIGQRVKIRNGNHWGTVRRVLPFGTVEVEDDDGKWFRLSGFSLAKQTKKVSKP